MMRAPRKTRPKLLLASASPRRRDLLAKAGYSFEVEPAEVDEDEAFALRGAREAAEVAVALAVRKALARARLETRPLPILAADTIVVAPAGELLGKPRDAAEARSMIAGLE